MSAPLSLACTDSDIERAAQCLQNGQLVAFPTETVYGLGADARNPEAVAKIFAAKGRPATNPLIIHVDSLERAREYVLEFPSHAELLAHAFWPGPLTLVLPKAACIADIVTAGGPTVAIRIPRHPIALALLATFGGPVAAPSANRSNQLSPTRAEHVRAQGFDDLGMILDGGPCEDGLESTVIDVSQGVPTILRPGPVLPAQIAAIVGQVRIGAAVEGIARSPGLGSKHYSPRTPLELCSDIRARLGDLAGKRIALVSHVGHDLEGVSYFAAPADARGYGASLYDLLHRIDGLGFDVILVEPPPEDESWLAARDRLARASQSK